MVWWVACPVSKVALSLHDSCAVTEAPHAPLLPACGLGSPSCVVKTAPGAVGFARTLLAAAGFARAPLAAAGPTVIVRDHAVPGTGPVAIHGRGTGRSSPLTGLGHGRGVGNLGGVVGIVRKLMVPPRIVATLSRGWSLLLRLRAVPSHGPSLLYRTSPGCSSVCWGPVNSGMLLRALRFRLLPS